MSKPYYPSAACPRPITMIQVVAGAQAYAGGAWAAPSPAVPLGRHERRFSAMKIDLQIGRYGIRLQEAENCVCLDWPLEPFVPFLTQANDQPDIDFTVKVVNHLPEMTHGQLIFDASHGLWKLYEAESGFLLESPNTHTLEPYSRALISRDFSRIEVWVRQQEALWEHRVAWEPLKIINPLVEVCLTTKLAREGGLLLHAAGVLMGHSGWVFTGPSGAGKSTLSDWFATRGACVLSDERLILRKVAGEILICGTPWAGTGRQAKNRSGLLTALYCIRHGEGAHALRRLPARDVRLFVLRQCFLPHWDRAAMSRTLAFLDELSERIGCFELAFAEKPDIVDYLEEQRLGRTPVPS